MTENTANVVLVETPEHLYGEDQVRAVCSLAKHLRARGAGADRILVWCPGMDEMPVKLAKVLENDSVEPTADQSLHQSARVHVRIWRDLSPRSMDNEHDLACWLMGRESKYDYHRATSYDDALAGGIPNRMAAYRVAGHEMSGQVAPWSLAPLGRALTCFPGRATTAAAPAGVKPGVPWPVPLPSPFLQAAKAIAGGGNHYWQVNGGRGGAIEPRDLALLREIDEALATDSVHEAGVQFRRRFGGLTHHGGFGEPACVQLVEAHDQDDVRVVCGLPILDRAATPVDVQLYLTVIGRMPGQLPLGLAAKLRTPDWLWRMRLSEFSRCEDPMARVPQFAMTPCVPPGFELHDDGRLEITGAAGTHALPGVWRLRYDPIHHAFPDLGVERNRWARRHEAAPALSLHDGQPIYLGKDVIPPGLDLLANLVTVDQLIPEIAQELARRRTAPAEDQSPTTIAQVLATGIWNECVPWPDPWHARPSDDEVWTWSSRRCREHLQPVFECLVHAPIRCAPSNLLATFLYLIADRRAACIAWPTDVREIWQFKLRTHDHSWLLGAVLMPVEPLAELLQPHPVEVSKDERTEVVFSVGTIQVRVTEVR